VVCLVAGLAVGQTFDPNRGMLDAEITIVDGKTNVIKEANVIALRNMPIRERATQWAYIESQYGELAHASAWSQGTFAIGLPITANREANRSNVADRLQFPVAAEIWQLRCLLSCPLCPSADVNEWKEGVKQYALRKSRAKLFTEGKSLLVKDGVNPLSAYMDPVVKALNAPACSGLVEALATVGAVDLNAGRTLPAIVPLDAAALAKLTEDAKLDYVSTSNPDRAGQLLVVLGVDGYNAFVKHFNEGK